MKVTTETLKSELAKSYKGDLTEISENTELKQNIDSLDLMDFYMNLEETYSITIPDEDIEQLRTLEDFKNYIEAKM